MACVGLASWRPAPSTPWAIPAAAEAYQRILEDDPDQPTRLKAATALCRIWRERGQLDRAIAVARAAMDTVPAGELATEESIRLSVTLAAALHVDGRIQEATDICDRAIAESERLELVGGPRLGVLEREHDPPGVG